MIVKIKRQRNSESPAYWQSFTYDGPKHVTVSAVLDALNYTDDLFDIDGKPAPRIRWECSCMQAVCGGCAMIINGVPALACATFADEADGVTVVQLTADCSTIEVFLRRMQPFRVLELCRTGPVCLEKGTMTLRPKK